MKKGQLVTGCWRLARRGAIHRARISGEDRRDESRPYAGRVTHHASRVTGFSLVAVLFLIVVIALLGAFAVRIGAGQQQTVNLALLGARALSAANSGIEYGAHQALINGVCANTTLNLSEGALNGFTVAVTCAPSVHADGGVGGTNVYRINAVATYGTYGQSDYVSRQVFATFMDRL
jgi:MSHA biogenesis protein MshP